VPKQTLLVVSALLVALTLVSSIAAAPSTGAQLQIDAQLQSRIVQDLNAFRQVRSLPPLRNNAALETVAREHTDEMASHGYFSHNSLDGSSFATRMKFYYQRGHARFVAGENLLFGAGNLTAESVIAAWAGSAPHRANLLDASWREIGVSAIHASAAPGAFGGGDVVIITADFGTRS
jgi:uncharacterized protein YkwD